MSDRTVVGGEVVGEHGDGLARGLGLGDGGLEPGHLLRVPAVRVRRPQLPLLWRTLRCTTINTAHVKHRACVVRVRWCVCVGGSVCRVKSEESVRVVLGTPIME